MQIKHSVAISRNRGVQTGLAPLPRALEVSLSFSKSPKAGDLGIDKYCLRTYTRTVEDDARNDTICKSGMGSGSGEEL